MILFKEMTKASARVAARQGYTGSGLVWPTEHARMLGNHPIKRANTFTTQNQVKGWIKSKGDSKPVPLAW